MVPANRLNRVGPQLSPDGEQAFIPKIFPFQNEGPGAANLPSALDKAIGARHIQNLPLPEQRTPFLVPRKGRLIADCVVGPKKRKADCVVRLCAEGSCRPSHDPRLSAWVAGKMATEKLVRRRTAEGAWLARRGRKATVAPLYCDERVRVSSRVVDGQLVAGCRRAPLV